MWQMPRMTDEEICRMRVGSPEEAAAGSNGSDEGDDENKDQQQSERAAEGTSHRGCSPKVMPSGAAPLALAQRIF